MCDGIFFEVLGLRVPRVTWSVRTPLTGRCGSAVGDCWGLQKALVITKLLIKKVISCSLFTKYLSFVAPYQPLLINLGVFHSQVPQLVEGLTLLKLN